MSAQPNCSTSVTSECSSSKQIAEVVMMCPRRESSMPSDLEKAQLGRWLSYSRAKVKFRVNCVDNIVIQAIFLLDTVDKDVNYFSRRGCNSTDRSSLLNDWDLQKIGSNEVSEIMQGCAAPSSNV